MDFVVGLPRTRRQHDSIWVIIDRMTKSAHFIPVKVSLSTEDYAKLYIREIVRLRGVSLSIISDRGPYLLHTFGSHSKKNLAVRRCRSPISWFEVDKIALIGPESVYEAIEKVQLIRERLKTAQSREMSNADVRRRELEFEIGDWVYLKISPMKGLMRFGKKGKLSPRFVGPYQILKLPMNWTCQMS
ncbi:hypothetical protein MTR67_039759 [Solanum verrucosum]|uniref:Tf2-1-like SH3-like domain-containing protein n=1 Tax=Solanum verrucosum TaxID=315347 RepID=A0AAF0UIC1_SOLVR|nr:hypothetical protein MTR67_039759 [Solanum verrucosum]